MSLVLSHDPLTVSVESSDMSMTQAYDHLHGGALLAEVERAISGSNA